MKLNKFEKFDNFFNYYLIFLCLSSIYFISNTYLSGSNNSIAEWLINYQGGFVRRGLLGELFTQISLLTEIPIRKIILYFLYFIFVIYYFLVFIFVKDLEKNYFIILSLLSPLLFIWPVAEREGLGRKDILIPLLFIFYCIIYNRLNFFSLSIILLLIYISLILIHEVSIFYLPYFYLILFFKIKDVNFKKSIIIILISIVFLFIIYKLLDLNTTKENINLMCDHMKNILKDKCGLGAYVLDRSLKDNIAELNPNFFHLMRNFFIFLFGYISLVFLVSVSHFNKLSKNIVSNYFNFKILILLLFTPTLVPFFIAVDWGRWFNLGFSMMMFFYLFCHKNKLIIINDKNETYKFFSNLFKKKKYYLVLTIIILCFSWSPKSVYHEDIGSIPIYRIIMKMIY